MVVLDASALLALLQNEPGADRVASVVEGAVISRVNLAEVLQKLAQRGLDPMEMLHGIREQGITPADLEDADVVQMARWFVPSRSVGLALGDLACLALAARLGAVAWTADRIWKDAVLKPPIKLELVR